MLVRFLHFDPPGAGRLLALILVVALAGCGDDGPTSPLTNGSLSMSVDGATWSATSVSAQRSGGVVSVAAVEQATITGFGLGFPDGGTGTFAIGATDVAFTYSEGADGFTAHPFTGSGSTTVTTLPSERVAGTFHGELTPGGGSATGNVMITNGTFDIRF